MLRRSPIDLSDKVSAKTPSVGIFFGVMHKDVPVILHEATPLATAEDYGLCKTHPLGHLATWDASRAALSLQGQYDDYPRGRIVFDTSRLHFIVSRSTPGCSGIQARDRSLLRTSRWRHCVSA